MENNSNPDQPISDQQQPAPGEDQLESGKELPHKGEIDSDEDLHQEQAGNTAGRNAEKDMLSGPQVDLVTQPSSDDDDD